MKTHSDHNRSLRAPQLMWRSCSMLHFSNWTEKTEWAVTLRKNEINWASFLILDVFPFSIILSQCFPAAKTHSSLKHRSNSIQTKINAELRGYLFQKIRLLLKIHVMLLGKTHFSSRFININILLAIYLPKLSPKSRSISFYLDLFIKFICCPFPR